MTDELRKLVDRLASDESLNEPSRLRRRVEAMDDLESFLIDGPARADAGFPVDSETFRQAWELYRRLEAVNDELFRAARHKIRQDGGQEFLLRLAHNSIDGDGQVAGDSYDYLDVLISGVLQFEQPDETRISDPQPEFVAYQPTPARLVFDLIDRLELTATDELVDIGSGLGHVPLVASICTAASCVGIESEAVYVESARRAAESLGLGRVRFLNRDARTASYSTGTVFYLYTPFTGAALRTVLESLRHQAARRDIRVCAYGPCTVTIAGEPWLRPDECPRADRVTIFRSSL